MFQSGAYMPWFPEPGTYIRQFLGVDASGAANYKYRQLTMRRDPLKYPYRFTAQAAENKSTNGFTFDELEPIAGHIYLAYLGVKPGFIFFLWHPSDQKTMTWDEDVEDIDEDLTAHISYRESPYEFPTKMVGIEGTNYPNVKPMNVCGETKQAEIIWVAALYRIRDHSQLTPEEIDQLTKRQLRSYPVDFGGAL